MLFPVKTEKSTQITLKNLYKQLWPVIFTFLFFKFTSQNMSTHCCQSVPFPCFFGSKNLPRLNHGSLRAPATGLMSLKKGPVLATSGGMALFLSGGWHWGKSLWGTKQSDFSEEENQLRNWLFRGYVIVPRRIITFDFPKKFDSSNLHQLNNNLQPIRGYF